MDADDPASDAPDLTSLFAGPFPDMFENPDPEVTPAPEMTRGYRIRLDLQRAPPWVWRRPKLSDLISVAVPLDGGVIPDGQARPEPTEAQAPTAEARRCHGDPLALWRHVAARLPMGRTDVNRQSGWVSLAVAAAGIAPAEWDDAVRSILTAIGWRSMYEGREMQLRVDNPTLDALETLTGMTTTRRSDPDAVAATAMAARTAIFGRCSSD